MAKAKGLSFIAQFKRIFWLRPAFLGLLAVMAGVEFVRGALFFSIIPTYVTRVLGFSAAVSGMIISAHYFSDTSLKSPSGWLVDRFGAWAMLMVGLPLSLVALIIFATAHSFWGLVAAAVLFALGAAPAWPALVSTAVDVSPTHERATTMGAIYLSWLVGSGTGTILVNFVIAKTYTAAFQLLIVIFAIATLLAVLLWARGIRTHAGTQHQGKQDGSLPQPHHGKAGAARADAVRRPLRAQVRDIATHLWQIRVLIPGMFVQTMALGMLLPYVVLYLTIHLGVGQNLYGWLLLAGGSITVLTLLPMGRMADRTSYRTMLGLGFSIAAVSLVAIVQIRSLALVFVFATILGASYSMILPAWNAMLTRTLPDAIRGTLIGVFMSVEGLGAATGPLIGGKLWESLGPTGPFYTAAVLLGIMAVFYATYPVEQALPFVAQHPEHS